MLVIGSKPETLPLSIRHDATTGLPLLREQDAIMQMVLAYQALPYSVAEYGCGKKASLIIDQLLAMGIPPYAVARGMILERDMSPGVLAETDYERRPHALVASNPLYTLSDLSDPRFQEILNQSAVDARIIDAEHVQAGPYRLQHASRVQFVIARSHIYTVVTFWDAENLRAVDRVLDPSLHRTEFFPVEDLRDFLGAPEGLLFEAPLLARFRLDERRLTPQQQQVIVGLGSDDRAIPSLSHEDHAALVRRLTGAEVGSIGDPETWTYANNITGSEFSDGVEVDEPHLWDQAHNTGRGDPLADARRRLVQCRENRAGETSAVLAELRQVVEDSDVHRIVLEDARWSARHLEPLADAAMIMVYFNSLCAMAETLQSGGEIEAYLGDPAELQKVRGVGVRLRRRIDWLGRVSLAEDGRIDARALTPGFVRATIETIRQMNRAGLTVFVDRVGNLHGLLLDDAARAAIGQGKASPADFTRNAIVHCSHIDTVNDAGKFDGRLGVLAGIETAHVLKDLERYFDLSPAGDSGGCLVSAFIGEEMTFTGQGVSMPGSAAVCGRATPERIHGMENHEGERFGDLLGGMLQDLRECQARGEIELSNDLVAAPENGLLNACSDPRDFYTPHSYERHIEQGPLLDRAGVPAVLVDRIMGIQQEDFHLSGEQAEAAALELNRRLRELTSEPRFADVRITVGMLEGYGTSTIVENVQPALRWTLEGELNHAGATPTPARRDPGVAAGRLARHFLDWFKRTYDWRGETRLEPLVSNVRVSPGTNRNVIPEAVSLTLALAGRRANAWELVDDFLQEDLEYTLEGYAVGTLARRVAGGGEGIRLCRVEPVSYTNAYRQALLSIDLRADDQAVSDGFRERMDGVIRQIEEDYQVAIRGEPQQWLHPCSLESTGQVLLMERSYGGSHNPRETELLSDLVRGCVLQTAVTWNFRMQKDRPPVNLFGLVESRIPAPWQERMARFTSGALHDTSNIAASAFQAGERGKG